MRASTVFNDFFGKLFILSFFLPLNLQVVALMVAILWFSSVNIVEEGWEGSVVLLKKSWPLITLYVLYLSALFYTAAPDLPVLYKQLEYKLSLGAMPLVMVLLGQQGLFQLRRQLIWFVPACIAICLIGNAAFFIENRHMVRWSHVAYRQYFDHITGLHPTYMGMYLVFAVGLLMTSRQWGGPRFLWLRLLLYFSLFLFLFALLPKTAVLALVAVLGLLFSRKCYWPEFLPVAGALFAAALLAYGFVPFVGQRIHEVGVLNVGLSGVSVNDNSMIMRQLIWNVDLAVLKEHWLWGVGPAAVWTRLAEHYFLTSLILRFPLQTYDTHNQYLDLWLSFGIFGFLISLLVFFYLIFRSLKQKDALFQSFLVIVFLTFFTENVLSMQRGVLFYAVLSALLLLTQDNDKQGALQ